MMVKLVLPLHCMFCICNFIIWLLVYEFNFKFQSYTYSFKKVQESLSFKEQYFEVKERIPYDR